jgi:hypothetical protein
MDLELWQRELAAFLAEHGHRTAAEIDLGMPRWSDDPTQVLGSLANYLRITDATDHPDARFARGAAAAEAAVAQVVGKVRRRSRVRTSARRRGKRLREWKSGRTRSVRAGTYACGAASGSSVCHATAGDGSRTEDPDDRFQRTWMSLSGSRQLAMKPGWITNGSET